MYRNYFKTAYRNLLRNKGYSIINIGGLAIGLAATMLIGLWVYDELSFDDYHSNHGQIAQVISHRDVNGSKNTGKAIPVPLEGELRSKYGSNFKYLATAFWPQEQIISHDDLKFTKTGNYMGPETIPMFSLKMLSGTVDALAEPGSVILSASLAETFFGKDEALGKLMKINNVMDVMVTGVYEDLPKSSSLYQLKFIAPWQLFANAQGWIKRASERKDWDMSSFQLYVQLEDQVDMTSVSSSIKTTMQVHLSESEKAFSPELELYPMKEWHLRAQWKNGENQGGAIQSVWLFGLIGVFVLLLACINFMNLSTAQSERRSKEVGIRKAIGSLRGHLIGQFFAESFLVVLLAFLLTLGIVALAMPAFNELAGKEIALPLNSLYFWLICGAFVLFTGLVSGSYPALYLSSFRPVRALKGSIKGGRSATNFRKVLVVLQFTVSISLIIGTALVRKQIQFAKDRPLGFNNEKTIMIWSNTPDFNGKYELLRTELKAQQAIVEMSESSSPLTGIFSQRGDYNWEGKDPNAQYNFADIRATHEYGETVGWEVVQGRNFSRNFATDSSAFILNERAVAYMGLEDPLGKIVKWGTGANTQSFRVIGVVKDMLIESPFSPVRPTIYSIGRGRMDCMTIRLNPNKNTAESLALVKSAFNKYVPAIPFDYRFADVEYGRNFAAEERTGTLSGVFALMAILISCLGLLGLASFVVAQRTKEIGIRKVLGASVISIWKMVSGSFMLLVGLSCLIAIPIAWYILNGWLQSYEYRTDISGWVFAIAAGSAMAITILTVSFHAIRSARMNPVKSLRSE